MYYLYFYLRLLFLCNPGFDEVTYVTFLILICTVYTIPGVPTNGYFYGMHSRGSDEDAHVIFLF